MLQGERVLKEPQVRLLAGECLLPVEAPAHQGGVAQGVQDAREALGEEGAPQVLRVEAHPRDPREDLSRGAPAVLPRAAGGRSGFGRCSPRRTGRGPRRVPPSLRPSGSASRPCAAGSRTSFPSSFAKVGPSLSPPCLCPASRRGPSRGRRGKRSPNP